MKLNINIMHTGSILMFASVFAIVFPHTAHAYDVGCIYPTNMPDPFEARYQLIEAISVALISKKEETPIVVYKGHTSSYCNMNCLAVHDPLALNALTMARPTLSTPPFGHNAFSIAMCISECYNVLIGPESPLTTYFTRWGLPVTGLQSEVLAATADPAQLQSLILERDFDPLLMGQLVALEIINSAQGDGWNMLGLWTHDAEAGRAVPCTANCQPFADTTGYFPRNNPTPITTVGPKGNTVKSTPSKGSGNKKQKTKKQQKTKKEKQPNARMTTNTS